MQKNLDQLSISTSTNSQESISSLLDSLVKICQSQEKEKDSMAAEVASILKQLKSLSVKDPSILSLKMSKGFSQVTQEKTLRSHSKRLPTLGMMVNGNYLIQGGFSPKTESEFTLLDILEESVDPKYFLSEKQVKSLTTGKQKSQVHYSTQDTQGETTKG